MGDDVEALCLVMSVENWRGLLGLSLLKIFWWGWIFQATAQGNHLEDCMGESHC